jgi:DNA-binding MarR family transcriptional regulator
MRQPRIFHLLHLAHRAVFRAADKVLASKHGISAAQQGVLLYLSENEGASMGALAEAVGLKPAATSGLVDRMAANNLLQRRRSAADKRSFTLHLLPAGSALVNQGKQLIQAANSDLLKGYSPEETQFIANFLEKVILRANAQSELSGISSNKREIA